MIREYLEIALRERVIKLNTAMQDDSLVDNIVESLVDSRLRSIKFINDTIIKGKIDGKPRKRPSIPENKTFTVAMYTEYINGEWALIKFNSLDEALNIWHNNPNSVLIDNESEQAFVGVY